MEDEARYGVCIYPSILYLATHLLFFLLCTLHTTISVRTTQKEQSDEQPKKKRRAKRQQQQAK